jgi:hypothetical protein
MRRPLLVTGIVTVLAAATAVTMVPEAAARTAVARRWGEAGHRMTAQAAAAALPADMPRFFRGASAQLAYLNPEPDRWRVRDSLVLDGAQDAAAAAEHFVDLELLPPRALEARDRYGYVERLAKADVPATKAGLLPYRILELTERLRIDFALWRKAPNARTREWIEQRIVNDAGILGHYVADGANPHHTTIHYNGWSGANPKGYATDRQMHSRFESAFVQAKVRLADIQPLVVRQPTRHTELRESVLAYLQESNDLVDELYALDKREAFNGRSTSPANRRFAAERLAAGATMLRDLWYTAWVQSDEGRQ